uniref:Reverse transcriptase domain-containing protein n=1 Tax=Tanacetum cinerariifolium TaxID=118510 RepID=A0A699GXK7_TANCI|nr:reverse transcriptase domain-containing protein [Tanacetum cinerariifolium]
MTRLVVVDDGDGGVTEVAEIRPEAAATRDEGRRKMEASYPIRNWHAYTKDSEVDMVQNDEALEINLDLLEERREQAPIYESKSKAKMEKYYNSKVRNTSFKLGDLVYRSNDANRAEEVGKLGPKWEGPYEVTEALGKGAYKLRDRDGNGRTAL